MFFKYSQLLSSYRLSQTGSVNTFVTKTPQTFRIPYFEQKTLHSNFVVEQPETSDNSRYTSCHNISDTTYVDHDQDIEHRRDE